MNLKEGEQVELFIKEETNLGYTVLINNEHEGLLYHNEVFTDIEEGMYTKGYIKKIREDELIDVTLRPQGFKNVIDKDVAAILEKLQATGYLTLTDKSSPELIRLQLQMSKKAFKRAVGNLYKEKKIIIEEKRIVLVQPNSNQ